MEEEDLKKQEDHVVLPEELLLHSMLLFEEDEDTEEEEDTKEAAETSSEEICPPLKSIINNDIDNLNCDLDYVKQKNYYQTVRREIDEYLIKRQTYTDNLKIKLKINKNNLVANKFIDKITTKSITKPKLKTTLSKSKNKVFKKDLSSKQNYRVIKKNEIKLISIPRATSQKLGQINKQRIYKNKVSISVNESKLTTPVIKIVEFKTKINKVKNNKKFFCTEIKKIKEHFKLNSLIKENKPSLSNKTLEPRDIYDNKMLNFKTNSFQNKDKRLMKMDMQNNKKKYSNEFLMKL